MRTTTYTAIIDREDLEDRHEFVRGDLQGWYEKFEGHMAAVLTTGEDFEYRRLWYRVTYDSRAWTGLPSGSLYNLVPSFIVRLLFNRGYAKSLLKRILP